MVSSVRATATSTKRSADATEDRSKRRKTAVACNECRDRERKCDGRRPVCGACSVRVKGEQNCIWDAGKLDKSHDSEYVCCLDIVVLMGRLRLSFGDNNMSQICGIPTVACSRIREHVKADDHFSRDNTHREPEDGYGHPIPRTASEVACATRVIACYGSCDSFGSRVWKLPQREPERDSSRSRHGRGRGIRR